MTESSVKSPDNRKRPRFWILICLLLLLVVPHCVALTVAALHDNLFFWKVGLCRDSGNFCISRHIYSRRALQKIYSSTGINYLCYRWSHSSRWAGCLKSWHRVQRKTFHGSHVRIRALQQAQCLASQVSFNSPQTRMGFVGLRFVLKTWTFESFCVGGSTTECLYVTDKLSWPWRLQDKLASLAGKKYFCRKRGQEWALYFQP